MKNWRRLPLISMALEIFKEREIYHKSGDVVHFIRLSARTQLALTGVIFAGLFWVAYASVNVVYKEQIIVALHRENVATKAAIDDYLANLCKDNKINCGIEKFVLRNSEVEDESIPRFAGMIRIIYEYIVSIIEYVEPKNELKPTDKLELFFDFAKFVCTGIAIGISGAVGSVFFRAEKRDKKSAPNFSAAQRGRTPRKPKK